MLYIHVLCVAGAQWEQGHSKWQLRWWIFTTVRLRIHLFYSMGMSYLFVLESWTGAMQVKEGELWRAWAASAEAYGHNVCLHWWDRGRGSLQRWRGDRLLLTLCTKWEKRVLLCRVEMRSTFLVHNLHPWAQIPHHALWVSSSYS